MSRKIDMIGRRFDRLVVLREDGRTKKELKYLCICDCGKEVTRVGYSLRKGEATSCGCKKLEIISNLLKTHGMTNTRLYRIWKLMKSRCLNKNALAYPNYGGRGITVCPEWEKDFLSFYNWSKENFYEETLTIDRINNNGNYEPSNCRWVTMLTQANNKRNNIFIYVNGEKKNLQQIADYTGNSLSTIQHRYYRKQDLFSPQKQYNNSQVKEQQLRMNI